MTRILVYEPLSAGDRETRAALKPGSAAHRDMLTAGMAMRDAIAGDLAALPGVGVTIAVGEQKAGHGHPVRRVAARAGEPAAAFLRGNARQFDACWVVAPESDGLLLRLYEAAGAQRWIGCNAAAIGVASSKQATCATLAAAGIVTPLTFAPGPAGRWIVKPDDGAGTLQTRCHATRAAAEADLDDRRRAGAVALIQPFVSGESLSISVIVGPVLARAVAFNHQRIAIDGDGWLHDAGVEAGAVAASDPRAGALHALAAGVAAAIPGLRGYVGIDVVWNDKDGPVVIEVNPRVTCAYVGLSAIVGRNLAADVLAAHDLQQSAGHVVA